MITFPLGHLKAASLAMADRDIRYYLCGVYVEWVAGRVRLVATDGHRCHVVESDETPESFQPFILPASAVKDLLKMSRDLAAVVTVDAFGASVGNLAITYARVDGTFPDYRRIMAGPDSPTAPLTYQPQFLADVQAGIQAAALSSGKGAALGFVGRENPNARGMFSLWSVPNFAAKLMPVDLTKKQLEGAPNDIGFGPTEWARK